MTGYAAYLTGYAALRDTAYSVSNLLYKVFVSVQMQARPDDAISRAFSRSGALSGARNNIAQQMQS